MTKTLKKILVMNYLVSTPTMAYLTYVHSPQYLIHFAVIATILGLITLYSLNERSTYPLGLNEW